MPRRSRLDTSQLRRLAADAGVAAEEMVRDMKEALSVATATVWAEARQGMPVGSGEGVNSIRPRGLRVSTAPAGIVLQDSVFSPDPQVLIMDEGRQVGATLPPVGPIRRWVELKVGRGQLDLSWTGETGEGAIVAAVHFIRLAIRGRGIRALHFMAAAAESGEQVLRGEVEAIASRLRGRIG